MWAIDVALNTISEETLRSASYIDSRLALCSSEQIVIYITVSGSLIPIRVMKPDSIASMKLRIQSSQGFVLKRQKLVFGGRELLRNDFLVKGINVWTTSEEEFEFRIDRHKNIGYLKRRIAKKGKDFVSLQDPELFCDGKKLEDQRLIDDISKNNDVVIHLVVQKSAKVRAKSVEKDVLSSKPPDKNSLLEPVVINPNIKFPSFVWDMINSASDGLARGRQPIRSFEIMGGTYFIQDVSRNKYVSIFKPVDEEPMAVNNPHGLPLSTNGEGLKMGT
ncbi:phosphatidylinositol 4-kinase gamma 4-like [Olea europaea subsp. europaea]|uniref:1-phosphatidylinositol 4-kinase n=1 Tax=Olea europaea subsp. europaea TaxID=158383 RepID=A0A8S0PRP2_OLEEU|nr:phosphatidylinositol 4-kinase gamma 4-like [Olea europaea subsp. europaea]